MGHFYDNRGRLACDKCLSSGDTRKRRCPIGWCPSAAYCARCWADPDRRQRFHAHHRDHCRPAAARYALEKAGYTVPPAADPAPQASPQPPPTVQGALF